MIIKLCYTPSENNAIDKRITILDECSAIIKGILSTEKPVLILNYKGSIQSQINYIHIPEYNRYYFINDIIDLTGGRYEIHCNVDVLTSFKNDILNLDVLVVNSENMKNDYISSDVYTNDIREKTKVINFSNGFNDEPQFVLITAGSSII